MKNTLTKGDFDKLRELIHRYGITEQWALLPGLSRDEFDRNFAEYKIACDELWKHFYSMREKAS